MPRLFKGTREILSLAGGTQNVKALYAGNKLVWGEEEDPLKDFIFLSYVNNFENGFAKSVVGKDIESKAFTLYNKQTPIGVMDVPYFPLGDSFKTGEVDESVDISTSEFYINSDNIGYLQAAAFALSGIQIQPNSSYVSGKNYLILYISDYNNYEIKKSDIVFKERQSERNRLVFGFSVVENKWNHFAVVKNGSTRKLYVNGELYFVAKDVLDQTNNYISLNNYDSSSFYATQLAIRKGDFSNGDTFPVPTEPYAKL